MEDIKFLLTDQYVEFSQKIAGLNAELKKETEELKKHYDKYVAKKKEFNEKKKHLEEAVQAELNKWEEHKKKAAKSADS
jgi:chromosome segregation ATPase